MDIASAIINQEHINTENWKPPIKRSQNEDPEIKEAEKEQYKIEYKLQYDRYLIQEEAYNNNVMKAYALFWGRCTKGMKNKIEARSDYRSSIDNNPIKLLMAIKEHSLNYQETRYDMSVIYDSTKTLIFTRQKKNETLQDYTKRFRVTREVFQNHLGRPIVMAKIDRKSVV